MLQPLELDRTLVAETDAQVREIESQISKLEEQVAALKGSISVLHAAKEPAQQRLDSYKYPVSSLANEIITDIFLHFLPTYPEPPPLLGPLSPTVLTHICRQWREIALTTPLLWRAIDLRTPRLSVTAAASLAPLWLERSGCLPLSIRATDAGGFSSVLHNLIPHRARLELLDLKLRDVKGSAKVLDGPSPLLRTLNISLSEGGLSPPLLLPGRNLPRLCTVVLFEDQSSPSFTLPWSQLTTLTLSLDFANCISVLRQTQTLVNCYLEIWGTQIPNNQLADLPLLCLKSLVLGLYGSACVQLLGLLITPALRRLELREDCLDTTDPIGSLNSFILKSGCTLDELRIAKASVHADVYYKAFPSISVAVLRSVEKPYLAHHCFR